MELPEELAAQLDAALRPTTTDIVRAKRAIVDRLISSPADAQELTYLLHDLDGVPHPTSRQTALDLSGANTIDHDVDRLRGERLKAASNLAIAELIQAGLIARLKDRVAQSHVSVPVQRDGYSFGYQSPQCVPAVPGGGLMLSRSGYAMLSVADPDVFVDGLDALELDARTQRSLAEALLAFNRGLYLASVSLLGAVSEGAWYAAGEQLRAFDPQLEKALDADRIAKVQERVTELLRRHAPTSTVVDLNATAARLRDLRNYGVHPRSARGSSQERFFTEEGAGFLLLDTHRYLTQLADVVAQSVAAELAAEADSP